MAQANHAELVLTGVWHPATLGIQPHYVLTLTNGTAERLSGFRLAMSGPTRIASDAEIVGGRIVRQLSNYVEIAPAKDLSLAPGESWTLDVRKLDSPIRHWTDGVTGGFLILADGTTDAVNVVPTRHAALDRPRRRGTARAAGQPAPERLSIVPWPKTVEVTGRRTPPDGLALDGSPAADALSALAQTLFPGEGIVRPAQEGGLPVELAPLQGHGDEGYAIVFAADRVRVESTTPRGGLYGLITLAQILRGARREPERFVFPASGRIMDAPAMAWRGCHLDVARRFYGENEIERFLAILAWNKLNVFHWHLSDDEAWRVEIEAFPQLTAKGAFRGHGLVVPPLLGTGPEPYGGFYSKDTVRRLVALAGRYGIDVVPEIDIPGHCYALLEALPQLRDPGENGSYLSIQSFQNNCLNPGQSGVYSALKTILDELFALFPSRYFHVGADEVPEDAWASSPAAKKLGLSGTSELQAHFLREIQAFITSRGKITGAWEEAAHGGGIDKSQCYLVGWRAVEANQKLAAEGYPVVVAPGQAYYLDMALSDDFHEPGAGWAGWSSVEKTYAFDPAGGWSAAERERLMGVQACIWSEPMADRAVFDRLVFPRLSAIAETGWTAAEGRDLARFCTNAGLMPTLYGTVEEPPL